MSRFVCPHCNGLNTHLHGYEGMLGNQDKMARKSNVCMGIQSQLILPTEIENLVTCSLETLTNELKESMH